jgi:hypothetical protein
MSIRSFDGLLRSASQQTEPRRRGVGFITADLPDDTPPEQRARFQAGQGATPTPLMCVEKSHVELPSSKHCAKRRDTPGRAGPGRAGLGWDIVVVAALSGSAGRSPTNTETDVPLQRRVDSVESGRVGSAVSFRSTSAASRPASAEPSRRLRREPASRGETRPIADHPGSNA